MVVVLSGETDGAMDIVDHGRVLVLRCGTVVQNSRVEAGIVTSLGDGQAFVVREHTVATAGQDDDHRPGFTGLKQLAFEQGASGFVHIVIGIPEIDHGEQDNGRCVMLWLCDGFENRVESLLVENVRSRRLSMNVNLLGISIGNTRTRMGVFVDGKLTETDTFENRHLEKLTVAMDNGYTALRDRSDAVVLLSSVKPALNEAVAQMVTDTLMQSPRWVERDVPIPIGRRLDREAMVGEDRLLNAAAAYDVMQQACVVVDAGTAITIDLIDGEGTFHGGAIAPGAQLMLDALNQRTAQLPEVAFDKPEECVGHNTIEAMRVGAFYGMRGMLRELLDQYAEVLGTYPAVVATGGDGGQIFKEFDLVDRFVPNLTLNGLAVTLRVALGQDTES